MTTSPFGNAGPFAPLPSPAGPAFGPNTAIPTPTMLVAITTSGMWVSLLGVIAFLVAALASAATVALTIATRELHVRSVATLGPPVAFLVVAATTALIGLRLTEYSRALRDVVARPDVPCLERAAERERALWLAAGFVAIAWSLMALIGGAAAVNVAHRAATITQAPGPIEISGVRAP
jgi:hypothetical protein